MKPLSPQDWKRAGFDHVSDPEVARKLGVTRQHVAYHRRRVREGPTVQEMERADYLATFTALAGENKTAAEIAVLVGKTQKAVRQYAFDHQIQLRPGKPGRPRKDTP